jgi:P27 family predicted phage terminase small subunit
MPSALRDVRGRSHHRRNDREPTVPVAHPPAPKELDRDARREWRRIIPLLADARILTRLDRGGLAGYCTVWSRWLAVERALAERGPIVRDAKGIPHLNPLVAKAGELLQALRPYLQEFGLSPSARSRIKVEPAAPRSELDAFKARHGG